MNWRCFGSVYLEEIAPGGTFKHCVMQIAKHITLLLLRGYKAIISPWLPPSCRYIPTCSEYAIEAVERFGVLRGSTMAVGRILRCHPFVRGGYDPVTKAGYDIHETCSTSGSN